MKKKALHIAFRFLLIANLLFSQFAVNLFHDRHDVHEQSLELQTGESALQKHGEHCKVCSLDIVFNLLAHSTIQLKDPTTGIAQPPSCNVEQELTSFSFSQDRAPPIFS